MVASISDYFLAFRRITERNKVYLKQNADFETKFVFANGMAKNLACWLENRCWKDPKFSRNTVSSIYYDTYDWVFLREKLNSDYLKRKIRVRWYSDLNQRSISEVYFLELKVKVGSVRKKIRVKTNYSGDWIIKADLSDDRIRCLPDELRTFSGISLPRSLFPVCEIRYRRLRFIEPTTGVRICLDYDISVPRINKLVFPRFRKTKLTEAVFEMKGHVSHLPEVLHQLTALGCRKQSFSKYLECIRKIMGFQL